MSGLPLVWGETGPFDPASEPAAAYSELQREFDFRPIDVLDGKTLAGARLLFLAQPKRLAPDELVALDRWVREGGRALILTDPILTWPSALPLGDIRRAPAEGMLGPLLGHWGLAMEAPGQAEAVKARWNGRPLALEAAGRLRSSTGNCLVEDGGWTAACRLERGRVRIVADADLLRESLWRSGRRRLADNPAVVGEWLDELAGLRRERPRLSRGVDPVASILTVVILVGGLAGIRHLLRRRRAR